jgi:predicted small integral membrane protein
MMILHDSSLVDRVPSEYWMGKSGMTRPAVGSGRGLFVSLFNKVVLNLLGRGGSRAGWAVALTVIGTIGVVEITVVWRDMSIDVAMHKLPFGR